MTMDIAVSLLSTITPLPTSMLVAAAVVIVTLYFWPIWRMHQYPPGPLPLPFVGHLHYVFLYGNPLRKLIENYGKVYGDVFTVWFGNKPRILLCSYEAIHEGFIKKADALSDRSNAASFTAFGAQGLIVGKSGDWQLLRRHALSVLREYGVGKVGMEEQINDEIFHYLQALDQQVGKPFNVDDQLVQSISNVITRIVFGSRFEYSSEQLANVQFAQYLSVSAKTSSLPFLRHIPGDPLGYQETRGKFMAGFNFAQHQIEDHETTLDKENPRDFIDSFLVEKQKYEKDAPNPFNNAELLSTVMQLYIAGSDTTSASLYWAFLHMLMNQDAQKKVQEEIDNVIGSTQPSYVERNSMPYTQAVLCEVLRNAVAVATIPHTCSKTVDIRGKTIPKGSDVSGVLWPLLYDPTLYSTPHKFNPSHFLDDDGNFVKPDKSFLPFGSGRRICLGEVLARTELFLFFVSTLQKYNIIKVPGCNYQTEGAVMFTYDPPPYKLILQHRL